MDMTKVCTKCQEEKPLEDYHTHRSGRLGRAAKCIACVKIERRTWRQENPEKVKTQKQEYYQKYKEQILAKDKAKRVSDPEGFRSTKRARRARNIEKHRAYEREYSKQRRLNDLEYRILGNLRNRIRLSLVNKSECTRDLLGCDLTDFIKHLESQFTVEMNWSNYGDYWSIDHIEPCCSFDLREEEQQKKCFHWSNCRPLSISDNSAKGNTVDKEKRRKREKTEDSGVSSKQESTN